MARVMDVANRRPLRMAVDLLDPMPGERVLDAGCGTGAAMAAMLHRAPCDLIGADASPAMIGIAEHRLGAQAGYVLSTIEALPLEPATFDAVLALNVLYFEQPDHAMLRRLHALLRPGGRIVAYVTHRETMEAWPFAREGLHRLYDAAGLRAAFAEAGFTSDRIEVDEVAVTPSVRGLLARAWC
jgi:ubiquinone/menaquinone biosynthesis C-methylase UbiE